MVHQVCSWSSDCSKGMFYVLHPYILESRHRFFHVCTNDFSQLHPVLPNCRHCAGSFPTVRDHDQPWSEGGERIAEPLQFTTPVGGLNKNPMRQIYIRFLYISLLHQSWTPSGMKLLTLGSLGDCHWPSPKPIDLPSQAWDGHACPSGHPRKYLTYLLGPIAGFNDWYTKGYMLLW